MRHDLVRKRTSCHEDETGPKRSLSQAALKVAAQIQAEEKERADERAKRRQGHVVPPKHQFRTNSDRIIWPVFIEARTRRRARVFGIAFVSCAVLSHFISVGAFRLFTQQSKAIESMDVDKFFTIFPRWLILHSAGMVCQAVTQYSVWELRMMVQWRINLQLVNALYSSNTFYYLSVATEKLTRAPEQVMCEEAFMFVESTVNLAQSCLREIPDLVIKMYLLFEYRTFFLVYAVFSLPLMGVVMQQVGKMTAPLTMNMLKTHADINFVLARTQNNAEQIALFRGGSSELRQWEEMLNRYRGCLLRQELIIPMTGVVSAGFITLVMLPLAWSLYNDILEGGIAVAEAFNYFNMVGDIQKKVGILGLTMSMLAFQEVRAWFMCSMLDASEGYQERDETRRQLAREGKESSEFILIHEQEPSVGPQRPVLQLRDVVVTTPASSSKPARILLEGVNLRLHEGQSLLIVGETGVGKSALLLSIQGLWYSGRGHMHRCGNKFMFCVPQRPYMFRASLRDNLMYPEIWRQDPIPDSKLREVLEEVNLTSALRHYDLGEVQPWNTVLSLGQQQRLAIARGLLMKDIRLLLLDEATSALDMRNERRVYRLLQQRVPSYVSVGHRPSLKEYHTHLATLEFNEELQGPETRHRFEPMTEEGLGAMARFLSETEPLSRSADSADRNCDTREGELAGELGPGAWGLGMGSGSRGAPPGAAMNELAPATASDGDGRFQGPSMERERMGGLPLVRRAVRDVILPLARERHFWVPVSLVLFLLAFNTTVLGFWMSQLMAPVTNFQDILRLRNRDLAWAALKGLVWQAPFIAVLGYFTTIGGVMLTTVLFVETKRGLARRYLDGRHNTYYHLHMSRLVHNPGTRISNWDTQTAIRWIADLVTTIIMSLGLMGVLKQLAAQTFGKLFIAYLLLGWVILYLLFYTHFGNYHGWLTDIMHLHANVIHTRENAEAVALLDGSESERMRAYQQLDGSITPGSRYCFQKAFFAFVSSLYYTELLDLCLMCVYNPMVLVGTVALGESETSKNLFRWASSNAVAISRDCIGKVEGQLGMERLWELMVSMTAIRQASPADLKKKWGGDINLSDALSGDVVLEFKQLALKTPLQVKSPSRTVLQEVSMVVQLGETVLIAGDSGIGKSSLVRAIAGLWRNGSGEIRRPSWRHSFFIAQRPYMCVGTLREQLLYPRIERRDVDDESLERVLRLVELDHLLAHPGLGELRELVLDEGELPPAPEVDEVEETQVQSGSTAEAQGTPEEVSSEEASLWAQARSGSLSLGKVLRRLQRELPDSSTALEMRKGFRSFVRCTPDRQLDMNWVNSLSLGEIQRISFARLLLQEKLQLVTLDEATSGLSPEGEEKMYSLIKAHTKSYVSVAHRPQLRRFHQRVLLLEATDPGGKGEPAAATCRDLPMATYQVELADQDRRTWGQQPDE